jgi:HPt (histidine-containing phosphotransfer) domain-containing protein
MDMQMPVMDGFTATRTMRAEGVQIPIFALTANAMKGAEKDVLAAGCSGFIMKPIDIDALMETLAALLGGVRVEEDVIPAVVPQTPANPAQSALQPAVVAMSGPPVRSRLAGMKRLRPAIRKFTGRLAEQLVLIEQAHADRNMEELAALAHWLKGAAGTVGYDDFTEPAAVLEDAAKAGDLPEIEAMLREVRSLAARLEAPAEDATDTVTA